MALYRGQRNEYGNEDGTVLLPSIYRWEAGRKPSKEEIQTRFNRLQQLCTTLYEEVEAVISNKIISKSEVNHNQLSRRPVLLYSIMQHYEYCPTPYLDVTQSLRIACMFALDGAISTDRPCVYMLGFPYVYDKFFRDSTSELPITRLLSAMPPIAKRAYYQEGYLIGSELDLTKYTPKHDVTQRLMAKFELVGNKADWIDELSTYNRYDIYSEDFFSKIKEKVISKVNNHQREKKDVSFSHPNRFPPLIRIK